MSSPPPDAAATQAPPEPESSSRWEDLIDIYIAPGDLFRRRAADRVGPPLIMLLVASVLLYLVLLPANREIMMAGVPDDPNAMAFMEEHGTLFTLFGAVLVPVFTLAMVAFGALLIWLIAKAVDVRLTPGRAFLISTYAGFVLLLVQVASGVLVLLQSSPIHPVRDLSLGPLRFTTFDAESPVVPLLRRFEVFAIWQAALWGVGVRHVAGTTAGRAAIIAGAAWALFAVPNFLLAVVRS